MPKTSQSNVQVNWFDQTYSIGYLQSSFDRIIGFVTNCDIKASIVLGVFGIALSGLLSEVILNTLFSNFNLAIGSDGLFASIYLIVFVLSSLSIISGLFLLVSAISARIKPSGKDSKIYFVDVAKNANEAEYKKKLIQLGESDVVDDLVSQIFINSKICTKKYSRYNWGLKILAIGFVVFLIINLAAYNILT